LSTRSTFAGYHPFVNYMFFSYVILVPILFLHPLFLAVSFAAALSWSIYLGRSKAMIRNLIFVLTLMMIATAINIAFNHRGATILGYLRYNPVTLESILFGVCAALMIGTILLWFSCYNLVMSSDKFLYLFGRVVPAMSLIVSMALRFIPLYKAQAARIASARRGIGFDTTSGSIISRLRAGGEILSVMVTWALENAIDTADSMRSRGYGLPGRTAYSNYRIDTRDSAVSAVFLVLICIMLTVCLSGKAAVTFYPRFVLTDIRPFAEAALTAHAALCFFPLAADIRTRLDWHLRTQRTT